MSWNRLTKVNWFSVGLVFILFLPFVAAAGIGAKLAEDSYQSLPSNLHISDTPLASFLYTADGKKIATFYDEYRFNTPYNKIPKVVRDATVAAEDTRFWKHSGVDPKGIIRALVANNNGETQGASTLTQQYVRAVLKQNAKTPAELKAATEVTYERKLREIRYATALEKRFTKEEILERYLNIVYFGHRSYGIGAAAQVYFSKPVEQLTISEAALLAGLVKSPSDYDPLTNKDSIAKDRRDYIINKMTETGKITPAAATAEKGKPLGLLPHDPGGSCATGDTAYGFYCDWFVSWWKSNGTIGSTESSRMTALNKGGYQIYSALDSRMQAAAQRSVDSKVRRDSRFASGVVVVEPGTGKVKAMAISRTYSLAKNPGNRSYPNTVNPLLTGSDVSPGYQAGSTFKMFTMVAALRKGVPMSIRINAPNQYKTIYKSNGAASCGGYYCPGNASPRMAGVHTMWSGFGESVNTFFIQLQQMATVKAAVHSAMDLGIHFRDTKDKQNVAAVDKYPNGEWGSFTLGTALVPPLDMANAYATVAARGKYCEPTPLSSVSKLGSPVSILGAGCKQVIREDVADAAADAAHCPVGDPAAGKCFVGNGVTAASVGRLINRPIAGKTGTTDGNRAAWFVGFTPNLTAASFYVDPDAPNTSSVPNSHVPIEVFKSTMVESLKYVPVANFVPPTQARKGAVKAVVGPKRTATITKRVVITTPKKPTTNSGRTSGKYYCKKGILVKAPNGKYLCKIG